MPVRPEELLSEPGAPIRTDQKCTACGYNLLGLKTSDKCPECGKPIRKPKELPRYADQMVNAPLAWLKGYALGTLVLGIGGWMMALSLLVWSKMLTPPSGGAALLGAIIWSIGAFLTTRPRPRTKATVIDPVQEWKILRIGARASQPLWVLGIAIALTAEVSGHVTPLFMIPAAICVLLGVVGWWPLMTIQSNLAYWASDTDLAGRLRNASWGIGFGLMLGMGILFAIGQGWFGGLIGAVLMISAWGGMILISLGYVLLALWQLWRMSHWVMLNHITGDLRDRRLRERARRAVPPKPAGAAGAKRG